MDKAFTDKELTELLKFENEHLKRKCYKLPDSKFKTMGFTIRQSFSSNIGISTIITCDCCNESKDVTDYDVW